MKVPLCIPNIGEEEERAVLEVLESKWLVHGPKNKELEENFAKFIGSSHAVTVNSCASALFLAIKALGLRGEIILPSFTFAASANAVEAAGAKPVFVDVDKQTLNIDPAKVEEKINKNTSAIMPVHIAGLSCDMTAIMDIAKKHNLHIIEDSAETIGGKYNNKKAGSFGIGCFSFFPTKNMTTGEGGIITTNDAELAEKIRTMMAHGMSKATFLREGKKEGHRTAILPGYNMRMSNLLAAIGVEQLKKLEKMNNARRANAKYLSSLLKGLPIMLPAEPKGYKHVYQMYIIQVDNQRDELLSHLKNCDIGATTFSNPPVHLQDYYRKYLAEYENDLEMTKEVSRSNIVLPMYPQLAHEEIDYIANCVKSFYRK